MLARQPRDYPKVGFLEFFLATGARLNSRLPGKMNQKILQEDVAFHNRAHLRLLPWKYAPIVLFIAARSREITRQAARRAARRLLPLR